MNTENENKSQILLQLPGSLSQGVLQQLNAVLDAAPVSCVLVRKNSENAFEQELTTAVIEAVQKRDVACLLEDNYELARLLGADGVHLTEGLVLDDAAQEEDEDIGKFEIYEAAREHLGEDAIIGGLCATRHEAMILGEQGAQYVALSANETSGELTPREQIQWWTELFELPCVAWDINDLEQIEPFSEDGADFLSVGDLVWNADEPANMMRSVTERL